MTTLQKGDVVRAKITRTVGIVVDGGDPLGRPQLAQSPYVTWLWDTGWQEPVVAIPYGIYRFPAHEELPDEIIRAQTRVMLGGEPWLDTTTEPDKVNSNEEA